MTTASTPRSGTAPTDPPGLTVATQNLYLGADLVSLFQHAPGADLARAVASVEAMVAASRPVERLDAVAAVLARHAPDVVGLQEVTRWRVRGPVDAGWSVRLDTLDVLLGSLAARGAAYHVAQRRPTFGNAGTTGPVPSAGGVEVELTGFDAVLVRDRPGLEVAGTAGGSFDAALRMAAPGLEVEVRRGWVGVDLRVGDAAVRVVSTHLEAYDPLVRTRQAVELLAALDGLATLDRVVAQDRVAAQDRPGRAGPAPVVLVGDLNARPGQDAVDVLTAAGYRDCWTAAHPDEPGFTCAQDENLRNTSSGLDHRIDYVLLGPEVPGARPWGVVAADVVGADPADRVPDGDDLLWPSDHAGVVVRLAAG